MKIERHQLSEITARDSFGRPLLPTTNDLTSFTCTNPNATDIHVKLVFKQKNLIKKILNTSRNITIESSKNCTHFGIGELVKRQALKSSSSMINLSDSNGNQTVLKHDINTLNLHLECADPENNKPFSFFSISFNSKQKRKNPENSFMEHETAERTIEQTGRIGQLVILSDSDVDSGEFSNASSDKEKSDKCKIPSNEPVVFNLSDSPYKKKRLQNVPREFSKKCSFPSPSLEFEKGDQNHRSLSTRLVMMSDKNRLKTAAEYFIRHYWQVPGDQFEFQYFQFSFNEFLHKQKLNNSVKYTEKELIETVGNSIKDQYVIQPCPLCNIFFFTEDLTSHAPSCCDNDDEIEEISTSNSCSGNKYTNNQYNNQSDHQSNNPSNNLSQHQLNNAPNNVNLAQTTDFNIPRTNSPELEYMGTSIPEFNQVTANDVVCITDQRPPSPVRTSYPHFDTSNGPLDKCPVCYMEFRRVDIERHTQLCCEKTFNSTAREVDFSGGCSSLDHPTTMPTKNRRIIKPK